VSSPGRGPELRHAGRSPRLERRRVRLVLAVAAVILVVAVIIAALGGSSQPKPPAPQAATSVSLRNPFGYVASRESQFVARATAGNSQVLFAKSPGGVVATAARVAAYRPLIDRVTAGTGIDANLLEGLVFVESAGLPEVIAGDDLADAAGLTQILAQTGQSLLRMHIDLAQSRRLTAAIDRAATGVSRRRYDALLARRAAIDERFDPAKELAATVRYLRYAESQLHREDLAFESYHMGIGNLEHVLGDYNGGRPVPYAQVYFDTGPDRHRAAYDLLAGFGDDSSLYYWRLLEAVQIMHLYRTDRAALRRLSALQLDSASTASVFHPPGSPQPFSGPSALASAYQSRTLVPLPSNALALGLAINAQIGAQAGRVGASASLYRGLRPVALRLLIALAASVRSLSGGASPLHVFSAVSDERYQQQTGDTFRAATNGYSFQIERRYVNGAQAGAFQAMLDRLQSLNLIAWTREPTVIDVTVASDAGSWLH
jgi:hypothetical protein